MLTIPTMIPQQLGDAEKEMYTRLFKSSASYIARTDTDKGLVRTLERIGLCKIWSESKTKNLSVTPTKMTSGYTVAHGRSNVQGVYDIEILNPKTSDPFGLRMATVIGATMTVANGAYSGTRTHQIMAKHENATDIEHDASVVFEMTVANVVFDQVRYDGSVSLIGTAISLHKYPFGVDPTEGGCADFPDVTVCDGKYCGMEHPYAPYFPPETKNFTKMVKITIYNRSHINEVGNEGASH